MNSRKILSQKFIDGLRIAQQKFDGDILREEAMIKLYDLMRPFEEYDYHNSESTVMHRFTEDEKLIAAVYRDMSIADHSTNFRGKSLPIDSRRKLKFKTQMKFKAALRIFIALARNALGKDSVKQIMSKSEISFKKFGREKSLKKYLNKHSGEIILRN